jgi:hypothetical protein
LPKICGNIERVHVSAALIVWLLSGCSAPNGPEISVSLQAHSLASCPLPDPALLDLAALGDFPISTQTSETLSVDATGTKLSFPTGTLAVDATATADLAVEPFIGYSERSQNRFDFLLWPKATACELFRPSSTDSFPGKLGGEALGYSNSTGLVMIAGSNDASSAAIVGALTFDTRTGDSHVVDPRIRAVLSEPRAFATVTDFAGKVLVAGGENPVHDASQPASELRGTAEIYDPTTQSFEQTLVDLPEPVTRHAATNLENGETLLLGGRDEAVDASAVVQVVSPERSTLLEPLNVGRDLPSALRLDDGRIVVLGGTDAQAQPIGALEWRDTDGGKLGAPWDGSTSLPARFDRAFVGLPGGALLAVGGCEARAPASGENCATWCNRGCPPSPDPTTNQSYDAYWVAADGSVSPIDFPLTAPQPILIPGSDGRPWLVAADLDQAAQPIPGSLALYRFDPWAKTFESVSVDLGFQSGQDQSRVISTGPDTIVWLNVDGDGAVIQGARLGTRSAFVSDVALVGSDPEDVARPAHLAPDRSPDGHVSYDGALQFEQLAAGATPTCVWIADAEYGDFSAKIEFSSASAPTVRLGPQTVLTADSPAQTSDCRFPVLGAAAAGKSVISVQRVGAHLTLSSAPSSSSCNLDAAVGTARIPFGVCQSEAAHVTVTQISVKRGD